MWSRTLGLGSALRRSRVVTAGTLGGQPAASQRALSAASAGRLARAGAGVGAPRSWSVCALSSRDGVPLFWATPSHEWRRYSSSAGDTKLRGHQAKGGTNALPASATGGKAADEDADAEDLFLTKIVEPTYPTPKPRTDINKVYFPGKAFRSTSRDVVFRAMAGNTVIMLLKIAAWLKTGSSAMLSEAIHSLVDTGNQGLLILGLRQASGVPDKKHQYGYGRAAYFWSLISALGIFWLGAGVTVAHGIQTIFYPPTELTLSWEVWSVLGCSFMIDGWVLKRSVQELLAMKPKGKSFFQHLAHTKDPFMMAVLLEDSAACTGVIIAACGIGASHITGNPLWDSLASISIGVLLGGVAVTLIRLNQKYLLGQSVEPEIEQGIRELLLSRPSIDNVYAVQSQWVGPSTFSYKVRRAKRLSWSWLSLILGVVGVLCRLRWTLTGRTSRRSFFKCRIWRVASGLSGFSDNPALSTVIASIAIGTSPSSWRRRTSSKSCR
jgi:cation diffusion facilitator family transporter